MTPIEEKSLKVQIELFNDVISNYSIIVYSIENQGKMIRKILSEKIISDDNMTVSLTKENFDKLLAIAYILQSKDNWVKIDDGSLLRSLRENDIKINILKKL